MQIRVNHLRLANIGESVVTPDIPYYKKDGTLGSEYSIDRKAKRNTDFESALNHIFLGLLFNPIAREGRGGQTNLIYVKASCLLIYSFPNHALPYFLHA